jgi:hypothetical protein
VLKAQRFDPSRKDHFDRSIVMNSLADLPGDTRTTLCSDPSLSDEGKRIIGEIDQSSAGFGATCAWAIWTQAKSPITDTLLNIVQAKRVTRITIAREWGEEGPDHILNDKGKDRIKRDGGYFSPITLNSLRPTGPWITESCTQSSIRRANYRSILGVFWADILGSDYKPNLNPVNQMLFCLALEENENHLQNPAERGDISLKWNPL